MKFAPLLSLALATAASTAFADWPSYLHDSTRVGHTEDNLAAPLVQRWEFASPTPPKMAWAGEDGKVFEDHVLLNRIRFDDVFHTAIVGDRVYYGSSVDGRVYCKNLLSGKEEWAFFTDGPIRLAPQIADGRLFIGSDDGWAYCLDAKSGSLIWKLRAGPNDERIIGRGRMISRWPIRTGILVDDGVAYFGAGVFPHENVYLYAVEAASGKVIWKNDAISQDDAGRNDLSPQGYLLATKDLLFVPSGRAMSVTFDKKTGQQAAKAPTPGWRGDAGGQIGGAQAMLLDDQILAVGEHQVLALDQKTGKTGYAWFHGTQMTFDGNRGFMTTGKEVVAIDRDAHAESTRVRHAAEMTATKLSGDLRKHAAIAALKKVEEASKKLKAAQAQLAAGKATEADVQKEQAAFDEVGKKYEPLRIDYETKQAKLAEAKKQIAEHKSAGVKWSYPSAHESALILAGQTLVVGGKDEVVCLDAETGKERWKQKVDGDARGLAAANGHLTVSTTTGKIYAFADSSRAGLPAIAKDAKPASTEPFAKDDLSAMYAKAAEDILVQTKIRDGFCLVIGSEKGRLAYEIAKRSNLTIYGIEQDAAKVAAARAALISTGLYGSRIIIDHTDLGVIPYASYFANLIVCDTALTTGKVPAIAKEVARNLKPIGGTICLGAWNIAPNDISTWLADTKLAEEKATITKTGDWTLLKRAILPGADSWSHQYGNAANTSSNHDERVKGGLNVLWYGDPGPGEVVNRHDGAVGPLSVNGRLFLQGSEAIMAYDAYNGQFLWRTPNPGVMRAGVYNNREPGNMAASDDHLYMLLDEKCIQFDAATGKIAHEFVIPGVGSKPNLQWGYIAYKDGLLYGSATERVEKAAEVARRGKSASIATDTMFAYDVATKKLAWTYQGKYISHVAIAIGDGRVFLIDSSLTPAQRDDMLRQDKTELAKLTGKERDIAEARTKNADLRLAVALDAKTGKKIWEKPVDVTDCSEIGIGGGALTLMYQNGHLVLGGANANGHYWEQFLAGEFARRRIVVLDAEKGGKVWAKDANYRHRPVVINNDIIAEPWSYDLYTGAQKMRTHPLTGEQTPWMFARPGHHCGAISATSNMMFFRSKSTAYYNLDDDEGTEHFAGQRLGCWINTIPANGLVMIPEASAGCVCLFSIASTIVFEPHADRMSWGVYSANGTTTPVQHMALNIGAPGDRRDAHGKLWLSYPRPTSRAGIDLPLDLKHAFAKGGKFYSFNEESYKTEKTDVNWVHSSGARGLVHAELPLIGEGQPAATYTVRLYFSALEGDKPGQRVFDVKFQDKTVLKGFDLVAKCGGAKTAHVEEFTNVAVTGKLLLELDPATPNPDDDHQPILNAIEVLRTNAKEITGGVASVR